MEDNGVECSGRCTGSARCAGFRNQYIIIVARRRVAQIIITFGIVDIKRLHVSSAYGLRPLLRANCIKCYTGCIRYAAHCGKVICILALKQFHRQLCTTIAIDIYFLRITEPIGTQQRCRYVVHTRLRNRYLDPLSGGQTRVISINREIKCPGWQYCRDKCNDKEGI